MQLAYGSFSNMRSDITAEEVSQHCKAGDAWISVGEHVYDVSRFAALHPGGAQVLLADAGTDATAVFTSFHDPSVLRKYHAKLCIGTLADYEPPFKVPPEALNNPLGAFGDLVPFGDPSWYQRFNSPYYTASHVAWRARMRAFVDEHVVARLHEMEGLSAPPAELLEAAGAAGVLAASVGPPWVGGLIGVTPPELGARGELFDCFHELIMHDELARCGDMTLVSGLVTGVSVAVPPVLHFGSAEMCARVVPDVLAGRKSIALAITEPHAGSDVAGLRCTAVRDSDDGDGAFVVSGNKKYITNGQFASYFVTVVRTGKAGGGAGANGLSFLLLERGMPGFSVRKMRIGGLSSSMSGTAYLDFENVAVPAANLLGEENGGFKLIMANFNHERFGICCQCARLARCCLEEALKHATRRETFGQKLHQHQAVRMKIAEMSRHVEALQAWLELVAYQMCTMPQEEATAKLGDTLCLLKVQASRTFELCARQAVHVFGGYGLQSTGPGAKVEMLSKQVHGLAIPGGAEDILDDFAARAAFKMAALVSKI